MGIHAGFQAEFTTNLLLLRERALICTYPLRVQKTQRPQHTSIEKKMKTEYDADAAFLYPITGRTGTPLFYALMLRIRGKKALIYKDFQTHF